MRDNFARDRQHLRRNRTFQIHARAQLRPQSKHIRVLNMAPVLTQMQRNEISTCILGKQGRFDWIGINRVTLLSQRCDVINIDAKINHGEIL